MYKLRDWVDESNLTHSLSLNERAVEYLENNEHLIDNELMFSNINAIHIIEKRMKYARCSDICVNKNAVNFLRNNRQYIDYRLLCCFEHGIEFIDELIKNDELEKIDWSRLSFNSAAIHILNDPKYYTYIDWDSILENEKVVDLIKNNLHMVDNHWDTLCAQPHLIDIIEENMDKIDWCYLSLNYNAIHILEKNMDEIYGMCLVENKNGFQLLLQLNHAFNESYEYDKKIVLEYFDHCEKNNIPFNLIKQLSEHGYTEKHMEFLKHNNNYVYLSRNPNIFEYDYKRMRETRQALLWYNDIKK